MKLILPTAIADFQVIRGFKNGKTTDLEYIYADKTELLYNLLITRNPYFFAQPRRFGKSLLVDTLDNILRGHRELFKGLWIDNSDYDWKPYPVIRLSLASLDPESVDTVERVYFHHRGNHSGLHFISFIARRSDP
ncbi:MAG: AAA family ATPase [Deltaproteobacteria bacterium]|nr:AAA family ATPase [Deltaproteobacteria bacterium]